MAATTICQTPIEVLMNTTGLRVVCGIQIQNLTTHALINPEVTVCGGKIHIPPGMVSPDTQGQMIASMTPGTACGSYGVVSWEVEGLHIRMVVMWSAPFNFDFYSNILAVGITNNGQTKHMKNWYKEMYYEDEVTNMSINRKKFRNSISDVKQANDRITITGTMGSLHQSSVKITVRDVPRQ